MYEPKIAAFHRDETQNTERTTTRRTSMTTTSSMPTTRDATAVSNKVQPLGLLLAGLGANEIISVIEENKSVPSFLRYDEATGETSTRLPRR